MKTIEIKQVAIILISSIGLYTSGNYMLKMSYIETLLDALNVFIFFISFFPFMFVTFALLLKIFKTVYKFAY